MTNKQSKFNKINLLSLGVASALILSACGESTSSSSGDEFGNKPVVETGFDEKALLANLVDNVITPTFDSFVVKTREQAELTDNYCQVEQALSDGLVEESEVTAAKQAARDGWQAAMAVWQQAELMQLGPLLENDSLLRNSIYSWPVVNSCAVDYDVVFFNAGEVNGSPYDITKRTASRKGLAALEYLLFNDDLSDSCETGAPDNWNNQTQSYRKVARCEFAAEIANDIHNSATKLVSLWTADGGYAQQLKNAGDNNSAFTSKHEAVNRISDAMFYLDVYTKDGKLAEPLGLLVNECGTDACPQALESQFAKQSLSHIINNLIGFDRLFTGEQGIGFDDFLTDNDAALTAQSISGNVQAAISGAQAYPQNLAETLVSEREQVANTHSDIKKVTDTLKADFINNLALELPQTSAGDND